MLQNEIKALQRQVNMINKTTKLTTENTLYMYLASKALIYRKEFYFLGPQQTRQLVVNNC